MKTHPKWNLRTLAEEFKRCGAKSIEFGGKPEILRAVLTLPTPTKRRLARKHRFEVCAEHFGHECHWGRESKNGTTAVVVKPRL
jgi:hypothetical protein